MRRRPFLATTSPLGARLDLVAFGHDAHWRNLVNGDEEEYELARHILRSIPVKLWYCVARAIRES